MKSLNNKNTANSKNQVANNTLVIYFALGMFAFLSYFNYAGVLAVSSFGIESGSLIYTTGAVADAAGVVFSYAFSKLFKRREKTAKTMLFICYPVAALLAVAAALVKNPAVFVVMIILFSLLEGFNTGLCARFLYKVYMGGGAGRLLGKSSCAGIVACYACDFAFPLDSPLKIPVTAACLVAAILIMMYLAARKLDLSKLMKITSMPETDKEGRRYYMYVLIAICGAIAILSIFIGVSDVALYTTLLNNVDSKNLGHFFAELLYLPGLFIAGLLADVRRGKYLPIASLACVFLSIPAVPLLHNPLQYAAYSGITYFTGGFFLMYIMMGLTAIVHRSRRTAFVAPLSGLIYFAFSGLGAAISAPLTKADVLAPMSIYAALSLCLLFAFYLSGGLRAVSLADPEPLAPSSALTLEEMARGYGITERETEVLRLLLAGKGTVAIAEEMFVVANTVQKYISSMMSKTGAESRSELLTIFATRKF